jgi:hypothetical protein
MSVSLPPTEDVAHGRRLLAGQPLVYHCNYYNYWLQRTLTLHPDVFMEDVIVDAAAVSVHAALVGALEQVGADTPETRKQLATRMFATLGFGRLDLDEIGPEGGRVRVLVSHYGTGLASAAEEPFRAPQSLFDAGFALAAAAASYGLGVGDFRAHIEACQSLGAPVGLIRLERVKSNTEQRAVGRGPHAEAAPIAPHPASPFDEAAVLTAFSGIDLTGNEEGLIPRFGVLLTNHFANFYNRISFEFVHRMQARSLRAPAERLLVDAGHRCAFHTFGGVMSSPEWDALLRPRCTSDASWAHGMVSLVNALGWGLWRLTELSPDHAVLRIYDDYESTGYLAMYGRASFAPSYLAAGGLAGLMNLVFLGDIQRGPRLDRAYYERVFESPQSFKTEQVKSFAMGDPWTEIVAQRG